MPRATRYEWQLEEDGMNGVSEDWFVGVGGGCKARWALGVADGRGSDASEHVEPNRRMAAVRPAAGLEPLQYGTYRTMEMSVFEWCHLAGARDRHTSHGTDEPGGDSGTLRTVGHHHSDRLGQSTGWHQTQWKKSSRAAILHETKSTREQQERLAARAVHV